MGLAPGATEVPPNGSGHAISFWNRAWCRETRVLHPPQVPVTYFGAVGSVRAQTGSQPPSRTPSPPAGGCGSLRPWGARGGGEALF